MMDPARSVLLVACMCSLSCQPANTPDPANSCPGTPYGDGTRVPVPKRRFALRVRSGLSEAFKVDRICLRLDELVLFETGQRDALVHALRHHRPVTWHGPVQATVSHQLTMTAVLRPTASIGYLRNYTFEIRSKRAVSPLAGTLDLELYEQGDDKTAYEERPAVRYEEQLFEVPLDESKVAPP